MSDSKYTATCVTDANFIDQYVVYLRDVRRMSPNTLESYARDLALLAGFAGKREQAVDALQRQDLETFVRQLMSSGLSPRSVARAVACVRGFYRFVAMERRQDSSPADDLRPPRAWASLPKFLSLDEVDQLLTQPDTATARGLRDKALIEVLFDSRSHLRGNGSQPRRRLSHMHWQRRQAANGAPGA